MRILKMTLHFKDPSYHDADGNYYPGMMDSIEGHWCTDPQICDHEATACMGCVDAWAEDYVGVIHLDTQDLRLDEIPNFDSVRHLYEAIKKAFEL